MQTVIQQVLAHAPNGQLPEELQWSMRMLLPREGAQAGFASAGNSGQLTAAPSQNAAAAAAAPASAAPQVAFASGQAAAAAGQGYTPQQIAMMQVGCHLPSALPQTCCDHQSSASPSAHSPTDGAGRASALMWCELS